MNLKDAYKQVGWMCKHFLIPKRSKQPKDLFSLIEAYEESGGMASTVQLRDHGHIQEVIENPKITKTYYSTEIQKDKRYLGLILLGIAYLKIHCEIDDLNEANEVMHEKMDEEIHKWQSMPKDEVGL